ncbi:MAG TPA: DNA polymerase ligase N-terminal domain-containing protein [Acidimicrobiales bacterium]|nr:DNA polymerase ligase N-terminal domain-containing protein [Acidimicrobiales bacterium]
MARGDQLDTYRSKRDFGRTGEPSGDGGQERPRRSKPRFVVQKHDASRLHYDFRLEVDGVMKSWAVPKGPSLDPSVKRLAVPTEDHPLDYRTFEGTIPAGEYGGGTVLVWDAGTYRNTTEKKGEAVPMGDAIDHGHVSFELSGKKLTGRFALTRFRREGQDGRGAKAAWLLVKEDDDRARPGSDVVADQPDSVKTGRSLDDVAAGRRPSRRSPRRPAS